MKINTLLLWDYGKSVINGMRAYLVTCASQIVGAAKRAESSFARAGKIVSSCLLPPSPPLVRKDPSRNPSSGRCFAASSAARVCSAWIYVRCNNPPLIPFSRISTQRASPCTFRASRNGTRANKRRVPLRRAASVFHWATLIEVTPLVASTSRSLTSTIESYFYFRSFLYVLQSRCCYVLIAVIRRRN